MSDSKQKNPSQYPRDSRNRDLGIANCAGPQYIGHHQSEEPPVKRPSQDQSDDGQIEQGVISREEKVPIAGVSSGAGGAFGPVPV